MTFDCTHRAEHGSSVCLTACPTQAESGGFRFARVERVGDLPSADPQIVDVALLDMHHGWPNLGHEAIADVIQSAVCDLREPLAQAGLSVRAISYDVRRGHALPEPLAQAGLSVRAISYDVRRGHALPEPPGGRHAIYVGTGGPGHLDPRCNDGRDGSQGIVEDPAWEGPLFALFDAIRDDRRASLFAICHSFGVMCRWLGVADAVRRGPEKGGKSAGIRHNQLSAEGRRHPWFARFAQALGDGERFPVLDNRLYDLLPTGGAASDVRVLAVECDEDGRPGEAVTMIDVEDDSRGGVPRILGVNHHPEIVNRQRQLALLEKKRARGGVNEEWFAERWAALTQRVDDGLDDGVLHLTSSYTLMGPLRAALYREVRLRGEALGVDPGFNERDLPLVYSIEHAAVRPY